MKQEKLRICFSAHTKNSNFAGDIEPLQVILNKGIK